MKESPELHLKETMTLRKFDGEYEEGMQPVEVVEVETISDYNTGEVISQTVTKKE